MFMFCRYITLHTHPSNRDKNDVFDFVRSKVKSLFELMLNFNKSWLYVVVFSFEKKKLF